MNTFKDFHLSSTPSIVSRQIPGPRSIEIMEALAEREGNIVSYPRKMPLAIRRAKGAVIEDEEGNTFLDFFAGCGVLNVGHSNSYVLEYVKDQQEKLVHALDFPTRNKLDLIEKIFDLLGPQKDQYKINFCGPTGADAIEAAVKLAKYKTGRSSVIAFQGSYHGMTAGSLSLTSQHGLRERIQGLMPYVHFVPYSYCYRCPFGKDPHTCGLECAEYLKGVLQNPHSGVPRPAAILVEPIQGEGGTIVPRAGYLQRIVRIAREYDVPVIMDEIQTGFFRTGEFLECLGASCLPDIITLSKGLGGIGFPISAILYRKELDVWRPGDHVGTFRGNQVSMAAANGALDFIKEYDVARHTVEMGEYFLSELNALCNVIPEIGDVRGRGLFIGVEYVKDRASKEPYPEFVNEVRQRCLQKGLLFEVGGHYSNVVRFVPPLIIDREMIDSAMDIFRSANAEAKEKFKKTLPWTAIIQQAQ